MPAPLFQKGKSGNPKGRPKGSKDIKAHFIDAKKLVANANANAMDQLEQLLGKAHDVVNEHLDEGSLNAAIYVLDRIIGKGGASLLPEAIDLKLSTIDDVIMAAQAIVEMTLLRKLSIDDAQKMLNLLSDYCSFRAFERIDELRLAVDELKRVSDAKTVDGRAIIPSWGRLSEGSETANKQPAE